MYAHAWAHTHWMISSPAARTLNRQTSNVEVEGSMGARQLYSPANSRVKSIKITSLSLLDPGSTLGTWQLHSSSVSAVSCLIAVVSRNQLSENGGLDTWVQVSITPPPSGITSGMLGPTAGWMVNSVVQEREGEWEREGGERGESKSKICAEIILFAALHTHNNFLFRSTFLGQGCYVRLRLSPRHTI